MTPSRLSAVTDEGLKQAALEQHAKEEASVQCPGDVLFIPSLRTRLLQIARQAFENGLDVQGVDVPSGTCLKYLHDDVNTPLDVQPAYGTKYTTGQKPCIWVRVGDVKWTKISIADYGGLSPAAQFEYFTKNMSGTAVFQADHQQADVAVALIEQLATHIECTKRKWMSQLGLNQCDVDTLSDAETVDAPPQTMMRATLKVVVQGRVILRLSETSVPLKRVVLQTVALPT